jgi:quinol monooxygenase YgiN
VSVPERRDDLVATLRECTANMPGCLAYIIAKDIADENTLWVREIWSSEAEHDASLTLPDVKDGIGKAKPLIANFSKSPRPIPSRASTEIFNLHLKHF